MGIAVYVDGVLVGWQAFEGGGSGGSRVLWPIFEVPR